MFETTHDFDSVIKKVLEEYHDIFEWVFENLPQIDQDQSVDAFSFEQDDSSESCAQLCDLDQFKGSFYEEIVLSDQSQDITFETTPHKVCDKSTQLDDQIINEQVNPDQEVIPKRSRGRPRKFEITPKKKSLGQLWEFLLELLCNRQTNPSVIRWVSRKEGLFKLTQNEKVAKIWGDRRQNPKMNYKKMSRTMRHYYKKKIMVPVYGKKLVYQFGPGVLKFIPKLNKSR